MTRDLPAEARLHLAAAMGPAGDARFRASLPGTVDWDTLLAMADRDRAYGALWQRVEAAGEDAVPADVRERLGRLARVAAFRQGRLEARLADALDALAEEQIPVLLLKGAALAAGVYGSFAERPMADLDLMVPVADAARAQRRLLAGGWVPRAGTLDARLDALYALHHHRPPLVDAAGSGAALEIHVQPLPLGHPFAFGAGRLWLDARPVRVEGREALAPSPPHQLLHLCIHFAWAHALRSGAWRTLRDVRTLAERSPPEWEAFVTLAEGARAGTCAYWTLRMSRDRMDAMIPAEVLAALRPRGPEALHARLERHFTVAFFAGAACPSPWLAQRLWEMAIRPAAQGHGAARPWQRDADFAAAGVTRPAESFRRASWRDLAGWRRWLAAVST